MDVLFRPGAVPFSTVTNLNPQPYPKADMSGWSVNFATGGAGTAAVVAGGPFNLPFLRATWTTASTEISRGIERIGTAGTIVAGRTYTVSAFVRTSRVQSMAIVALPTGSNGAGLTQVAGPVIQHVAATWTYHSVTWVAPANAVGASIRLYSTTVNGGTAWAVGDQLDVTGVMLTEGPPVAYFDGNSPEASWAGTAGDSRSSSLALYGIYPVSRLAEMGSVLHAQGVSAATTSLPKSIPANSPVTMYSAHVAGTTTHRANFINGTSSVFATGRNAAGTAWFVLGMNTAAGSTTTQISRSTGPNVVGGVREEKLITVHTLAGNTSQSVAINGWPPVTLMNNFTSATDVRHAEIWNAVHPVDIRYARMAQLRTTYGIAI